MKTKTDIRQKIAVRAHFLWLNGSTVGAEANWLEAEQIEKAYAERRASAARKAAETRKAKASTKAPAEMLVATTRRQAGRRPTAH